MSKLHDVYLSLGTNLGNKEENILQAIKNINERVGLVLSYSAFYITEPVGFESTNNFINAACIVLTSLSPLEVLAVTQEIEKEMGRMSKSIDKQYADRIIDIDIIFYDDLIFEDKRLTLPHPHMHERAFVLEPMVELAADYRHPTLGKNLDVLLQELFKKG